MLGFDDALLLAGLAGTSGALNFGSSLGLGAINNQWSKEAQEQSLQDQMYYDAWRTVGLPQLRLQHYGTERQLQIQQARAQRAALEGAGYNPLLQFDGGGSIVNSAAAQATLGSAPQRHPTSAQSSKFFDLAAQAQAVGMIKNLNAQNDNLVSQNKNIDAQTDLIKAQTLKAVGDATNPGLIGETARSVKSLFKSIYDAAGLPADTIKSIYNFLNPHSADDIERSSRDLRNEYIWKYAIENGITPDEARKELGLTKDGLLRIEVIKPGKKE